MLGPAGGESNPTEYERGAIATSQNDIDVKYGEEGRYRERGSQNFLYTVAEQLSMMWGRVAGPGELRLTSSELADRTAGHADDAHPTDTDTAGRDPGQPRSAHAPDDDAPNTATPWSGRSHAAHPDSTDIPPDDESPEPQ
ncbi:hypothetical protein AB0B25_16920 [Nocardia sp. NPDC049190]|uniref:hypothetical protein n=1 Tax=Nocardia sp. NPDC049190 TaxID=3155650 RepID=UPI00340D9938